VWEAGHCIRITAVVADTLQGVQSGALAVKETAYHCRSDNN